MDKIPVYKTQGIILKKTDLSDTDRLLTVYTQKFGKILVRAKGIGKKESKLKSLIEPFNLYEFLLAKSKTIDVLTGSWPIKEFVYLRQNFENLALAIYFAELIDKLVVAPERDEKIWALLKRAMEVLGEPDSVILRPPHQDKFGAGQAPAEESPAHAGKELPHTPASLSLQRGERGIPREVYTERSECARNDGLNKIKSLFEQKLLEFLGHGIPKNKKALEVIQGLIGEEIKSKKFLSALP